MNDVIYDTRERWLEAAIAAITPLFDEVGAALPQTRVALGWPIKKAALGECWSSNASEDGARQIFIAPTVVEPITEAGEGILETLMHELCHAALSHHVGHKAPWKRLCRQIGLEPGPRGTSHAGPAMVERLNVLADQLGPFPHARLRPAERKRQSTRMIKCSCPECGYVVRTTRQWINQSGAPLCPSDSHTGHPMAVVAENAVVPP